MEYISLEPQGILKMFTLAEVFMAQIIIITFIGILASEIFTKLDLKSVNGGEKIEQKG